MPLIDWPMLGLGILLCVAGWSLYWIGLHLTGGLAGGSVAFLVAWFATGMIGTPPETARWILPLAGAVGFVAGMFLMRGLHRFLFFLVGATIGTAAGHTGFGWTRVVLEWPVTNLALWQGVYIVAGALIGGLLLTIGSQWVVALLTSVAGAGLVVLSIQDPLALLGFVPLAAASFFLQIGLLRALVPEKQEEEEE